MRGSFGEKKSNVYLRRVQNIRTIQPLMDQTKLESTSHPLSIEDDDTLKLSKFGMLISRQ